MCSQKLTASNRYESCFLIKTSEVKKTSAILGYVVTANLQPKKELVRHVVLRGNETEIKEHFSEQGLSIRRTGKSALRVAFEKIETFLMDH